jgi:hypothetical protein
VAIFLRMVGPAVGRTDTYLGSFHRRMRARARHRPNPTSVWSALSTEKNNVLA